MITISVDMNDYFPNLFQSQLFKAITTMYCGDHNKCKSEMNDSDRVRWEGGKLYSWNIPIYTWSGVILIQANCDKSRMPIVILRATVKNNTKS